MAKTALKKRRACATSPILDIEQVFEGIDLLRFAEAEQSAREGLAIRRQRLGNQHDETAWGLHALSFAAYERRVRGAMEIYREMVENFYTTPFMELFLEPRAKWGLAAAVNAVLAGELEGGWRLRWRMRLFFLLVKLQAKFPLVPGSPSHPPPHEHRSRWSMEAAARRPGRTHCRLHSRSAAASGGSARARLADAGDFSPVASADGSPGAHR